MAKFYWTLKKKIKLKLSLNISGIKITRINLLKMASIHFL